MPGRVGVYATGMSHGFEADPEDIAALGSRSLTASQRFADANAAAQTSLSIPETSFGNSMVGSTFNGTYGWSVGHAGTLMDRLVGVLEGDCDRLYQTAFHYDADDAAAAGQLGGRVPDLPVPPAS